MSSRTRGIVCTALITLVWAVFPLLTYWGYVTDKEALATAMAFASIFFAIGASILVLIAFSDKDAW